MNVIPKKSVLVLLSILLVVGVIFAAQYQSGFRTHRANMIKLNVEGSEMSLQDAVNGGFLVDVSTEVVSDSNVMFNLGHNLDEIFLSLDGVEMTLKEAVESKNFCVSQNSSYESEIEFGHNANEIFVSVDGETVSLQDSINRGDYCCVPEYNLDSSGCKYYSSCDGSFYENAADGTSCGDYMECNSGVCEQVVRTCVGICSNSEAPSCPSGTTRIDILSEGSQSRNCGAASLDSSKFPEEIYGKWWTTATIPANCVIEGSQKRCYETLYYILPGTTTTKTAGSVLCAYCNQRGGSGHDWNQAIRFTRKSSACSICCY